MAEQPGLEQQMATYIMYMSTSKFECTLHTHGGPSGRVLEQRTAILYTCIWHQSTQLHLSKALPKLEFEDRCWIGCPEAYMADGCNDNCRVFDGNGYGLNQKNYQLEALILKLPYAIYHLGTLILELSS